MTARGGLAWALLAAAAAGPASSLPQGPQGGGVATIEVHVSKRGFEPSRIGVRKGEATRIVLTSSDVEHCFAIDGLRVEKRVVPGRETRLELVPGQAGTFPFYCCLESGKAAEVERGELTVAE